MTRDAAQEVTEKSPSPTFDSCCLSGLGQWWLQGVQCRFQAQQVNPDFLIGISWCCRLEESWTLG